VGGKEPGIERSTFRWTGKRLLLALAFLIGVGGLVLIPPYNFYTAWTSHTIYIRVWRFHFHVLAQISYDAHPIIFWSILLINILSMAVLIAVVVILARAGLASRNRWHRRKTRPPTDNGIRQSISER
jgi:hypothetical protein